MNDSEKRDLVLFVCCGNRERSVIAENLFREALHKGYPDRSGRLDAASAGIFPAAYLEHARKKGVFFEEPFFHKKPNTYALHYLARRGMDVSSYRSRQIDGELVKRAILILAIDHVLKEEILRYFPESGDMLFTFREFVFGPEGHPDIGDPLKVPVLERDTGAWIWPEDYPASYIEEIEECMERGMEKIVDYIGSGRGA